MPKTVIEQLKAKYQLALLEIRQSKLAPENAEALLPDELLAAIERIRQYKRRV